MADMTHDGKRLFGGIVRIIVNTLQKMESSKKCAKFLLNNKKNDPIQGNC
jgi:hypothetical protein